MSGELAIGVESYTRMAPARSRSGMRTTSIMSSLTLFTNQSSGARPSPDIYPGRKEIGRGP
jgi:hypothetical protein